MKQYFLKDTVINSLLGKEECKDFVAAIISEVMKLPYDKVKDNLRIKGNYINTNVNRKNSVADNMYNIEDGVINIEINYSCTKESVNKNMRYLCNLLLDQVDIGKKDIYDKVTQININNYDYFKKGEFIYHSTLRDEKYNLERSDLLEIYDINMEYLRKISYNQVKKLSSSNLKRLLYILICEDKDKRDRLYRGDEMMEKVNDELYHLTEDGVLYYDVEEFHNREAHEIGMTKGIEEGLKKGLEQGLKKGLEQGKREKQVDIIKRLCAFGMSIEDISKVLDISIEEINDIIK